MRPSVWSLADPASATRPNLVSASRDRSLRLRMVVRVTRVRLDREIATGAPVDASPARLLRATQLTSRSTRHAVAAALAGILDGGEERRVDPGSSLILEHEAVLGARNEILELIALLRSGTTLAPRAVALATRLAEASDSPVFSRSCPTTIGQALAEIAAVR